MWQMRQHTTYRRGFFRSPPNPVLSAHVSPSAAAVRQTGAVVDGVRLFCIYVNDRYIQQERSPDRRVDASLRHSVIVRVTNLPRGRPGYRSRRNFPRSMRTENGSHILRFHRSYRLRATLAKQVANLLRHDAGIPLFVATHGALLPMIDWQLKN